MKKKSIVLVLTICLMVMLFSGCSTGGFDDKISEIRDCVYEGVADGYDVTAMSGEREENYCVDGVAHKRREFFIITLCGRFVNAPTYRVEIEGEKYEGTMTKHPFNDEYTCEIPRHVHAEAVPVTFIIDKNEVDASLKSVLQSDFASWQTARDLAVRELGVKEDFEGEIYVRLIENPVKDDGAYFWYVAFCTSKDECVSVLISAQEGKVIAKKTA